jgi:hypothetical protein
MNVEGKNIECVEKKKNRCWNRSFLDESVERWKWERLKCVEERMKVF